MENIGKWSKFTTTVGSYSPPGLIYTHSPDPEDKSGLVYAQFATGIVFARPPLPDNYIVCGSSRIQLKNFPEYEEWLAKKLKNRELSKASLTLKNYSAQRAVFLQTQGQAIHAFMRQFPRTRTRNIIIFKLSQKGKTTRALAERFKVDQRTIQRIIKEYKKVNGEKEEVDNGKPV